jgi:hypothetical protein
MKSSDRKCWQRSQLYPISAVTSDQYTYFDLNIAERHSVASSFFACQRLSDLMATSAAIGADSLHLGA